MQIVFDNIIYSKENQGGISNYWFELTKTFLNNNQAIFYEEKTAINNIFRQQISSMNTIAHKDLPLSLARLLPIKFTTSADGVLYHSSFYRKLNTNANISEITTIHDFLHQKHSSTPINKFLHNTLKFGTIKRAKGIICVSHNTFSDLKEFCAPKKTQRVEVIYNGVSNDYKQLNKDDSHQSFLQGLNLDDKFLLFVGARSKYKNFDLVVEILNHLPDYTLVVVGNNFTEAEKSAIPAELMKRIVVAHSISNQQLNVLYNYASALLYPSSYEGFGFPMVEAMKAGCPVLAQNITSIPEIAGGAAILFDDLNAAKFAKAIKALENESAKIDLVSAGLANAERFNWTKCLNNTLAFYKEICPEFSYS